MVFIIPVFSPAQPYEATGKCSYYADKFQGHNTSSGEKYDKYLFTAAHHTLPYNTLVKVTNLKNGKSVIVRINDRGPNARSRIIDVSRAAAEGLEMIPSGVITVHVQYAGMANADSVKAFLEQRKKEAEMKKENKSNLQPEITVQTGGLVAGSYYDHDLNACKPKGFGVQVGYFKNLSNCRNAMHDYEAKYKISAFIYVKNDNNSMFYKLILGQLSDKGSAAGLRDQIRKDIPDCFIVSYDAN